MKVDEWQKRLEDNFTYNGVIGGKILPSTIKQERICGSYFTQKFHGHRVLADSFLDFFAVTVRSEAEVTPNTVGRIRGSRTICSKSHAIGSFLRRACLSR